MAVHQQIPSRGPALFSDAQIAYVVAVISFVVAFTDSGCIR